jgi:hypothetical protein
MNKFEGRMIRIEKENKRQVESLGKILRRKRKRKSELIHNRRVTSLTITQKVTASPVMSDNHHVTSRATSHITE